MLDNLPILPTDTVDEFGHCKLPSETYPYVCEYIDKLVELTGDDDAYVLFMKFIATFSGVTEEGGELVPVILDDDITLAEVQSYSFSYWEKVRARPEDYSDWVLDLYRERFGPRWRWISEAQFARDGRIRHGETL